MPAICETVTTHTDEVWRLVWRWSIAVTAEVRTRLNVVPDTSWHLLNDAIANVLPILWVILWLLTINERNSIDIVILMISIFITSHDQVFLCLFQADGTNWLSAFTRYIDICHILVRATSWLWRYMIMSRCSADTYWITQFTLWANGRKHRLRQFMDAWRIVKIYILLILNATVTMNWRLISSLIMKVIVSFLLWLTVAWTVTEMPLVVIRIVIVIRKVILRGIVS